MTSRRLNRVQVRTPEGVVFTFPLAGPVTRGIAWVIDTVVIIAAATAMNWILVWFALVSRDLTAALMTVSYFVLGIGYNIVLEYRWRGQTFGKRLLALRVVDSGGLPLTLSQIVLRNLVRVVDQIPSLFMVGGISMMLTRSAQRLGDLAAGTIVVRHLKVAEPDLKELARERFNSLRAYPHLAARLRQRVSPVLASAAVDALLRREQLEPAARVAVFHELADAFRRIVPFPPEVAGAIPDEAYVRGVVEIVHSHLEPERGGAGAARAGVAASGAVSG